MYLKYFQEVLQDALNKVHAPEDIDLFFEVPNNPEHGNLSTNIAMKLAKSLKLAPRQIAEKIVQAVKYDESYIEKLNIAGAGFINIKFGPKWYSEVMLEILKKSTAIGRLSIGKGLRVNVEYVSVNPTGLLHLGHGRNASIGDSIANLFEWLGYDITREYYFNNAGNQMNNLAKSIYARYVQNFFNPDFPFPDDGYHGEYINEIAHELHLEYANSLHEDNVENLQIIKRFGENWCFRKIKLTLERLGIRQDVYFNEDSLYSDGKINAVIDELRAKELVYEKDGATWLSLTKMGLESDRVIVKSSGEPTYRLPDIAYHKDKFERGFDLIIDIFGSDHIATVPDVLAGVKALGYDEKKVKVLIHQFVTLLENGEQVKMSKRTGKSYTLDDLLDEVGADVVRFFLIMRSMNTHLEFDLNLAREQSDKNPVFYLQYAHARICSLLDNAKSVVELNFSELNYDLLNSDYERTLIIKLSDFESSIMNAAERCEPQILSDYLRDLASSFHTFYHHCRIIGSEESLMNVRLALAIATKNVLKNGLEILGISAPERM